MTVERIGDRRIWTALLPCFLAGGLYGWSAMAPALLSTFPVGVEQVGLVFSLAIIAFSLAVFWIPRAFAGMVGSNAIGVCGLFGGLAVSASCFAPSYALFLVSFSVGFGAASGAIYILALDAAGRTDRPLLMTPLTVASFGLGGALFGPALRQLVDLGWGMSALWILAVPLVVVSAIIFALPGGEVRPDSARKIHEAAVQGPISSSTIILLWFAFGLGSAAGLMTLGLAATIVESQGGAVWLSALTLSLIAVGNTVGRLAVGFLAKTYRLGSIGVGAGCLCGAGLVIALMAGTPGLIALGLILVASGYGLVASLYPTLTRHLSGPEGFSRTYSWVFTAWGTAGLIAPWAAGRLFDMSGSFSAPIGFALAASILSAGLAWALRSRSP
ncbi:MAG: MFS transporter [Pseudomonadota bacterium]